ncbi:MAG: response regulator [Aquabacterium sp.]|nr:MAG: response regulator [Aquabacterium sp.]
MPTSAPAASQPLPAFLGRPRRIRFSLALLVIACTLPGALMSSAFIVSDYQRQREHIVAGAVSTVRSLAFALDKDLTGTVASLQVLSTAPSLLDGDLPTFHARAKAVLAFQNVTNFVLLDAQGRQLLNTLKPMGAPLPVKGGPPELLRVFGSDQAVITDLFQGPVAGKPILALAVPVHRHGRAVYAMAAGVLPERMNSLLRSQRLPPGWIGAILDSRGRLVARTHEPERFVGKPAVPDLVRAAASEGEGRLETVTLEGIPVVTVFVRSSVSRWTVAIGIPRALLTAGLEQSVLRLVVANAVLFAITLWLAWWVGMVRVVRPANRLLERMHRMSAGGGPASWGGSTEFVELEAGFDRLRERLRLRDQERDGLIHRLTDTLESIGDGFFLLDDGWRFVYVNAQAEELLRCDRKAMIGRSLWAALDAPEAAEMQAAFREALACGRAARFEVRLPRLDAWFEFNAYPGEEGLSIYFRDVAALRQAEQARESQRAAEAANKAKTEFMSRMSHELRTPLNAVIGFAQLLRMDTRQALDERQLGMVEHIESAGHHLLDMIRDILDLSRLEGGSTSMTIEPVDARLIVGNCGQLVSPQAIAAGVSLEVAAMPDALHVMADATRLRQVLLNLLSNAIKYNRRGGSVTLSATAEGAATRFSVSDTGLGMSPSQLAHLFEPFNRLGREQGTTPGTGIGLVICNKLLELMGSRLEVTAHEGRGSTFSFSLPNTAPAATVPDEAPPGASPAAYGARRMLCVEDNPISSRFVEVAMASRPQIEMAYASTVAEAMARVNTADFDLVLLDMQLPDGNGLDVLSWLHRRGGMETPVIVVSGDPSPQLEDVVLKAGAARLLRKPLDVASLLQAVDRVLEEQAVVH